VAPSDRDQFLNDDHSKSFAQAVVKAGDVVVSLMPPRAYVYQARDPAAVAGPHVALIRARANEYISTYLNTDDGKQLFQAQAERAAYRYRDLHRLSVSALRELRIPILPLENLNAVSDKSIGIATANELLVLQDLMIELGKRLEAMESMVKQRFDLENASSDLHKRFVGERLDLIDAKLDHIVHMLSTMREDIRSIKHSSRDDVEKFARMYSRLDSWMEAAVGQKQTMEEYTCVVRTWLDHWDRLEPLTRTFLPSAEHLYDELEKIGADDFSPFVVQYCRSLENEILLKLFCAYHDNLERRETDIHSFVAWDLEKDKSGKPKRSARFAESIRKDNRRYTLGDMNFILQLTKPDGTNLGASPLLQDFRKFVLRYFAAEIADSEFLDLIKRINEELRNKAAHPSLVPKALAEECMLLVRPALCELLQAWHENPLPSAPRTI
jgi:hypothetical protein